MKRTVMVSTAWTFDDLIAKYSGPYQGGLKLFNSAYRNDQKEIAKLTNDGKVPKKHSTRPNRR